MLQPAARIVTETQTSQIDLARGFGASGANEIFAFADAPLRTPR